MSEPDDDRDLDAFLRRQSPLAQAWREAADADRAPTELDAAILAAAAAATPAARVAASRLRRWRLPIGLAASLVVGIGVLREAERDPRVPQRLQAPPVVVAAPAAEAAPSALPSPPPPPMRPAFPAKAARPMAESSVNEAPALARQHPVEVQRKALAEQDRGAAAAAAAAAAASVKAEAEAGIAADADARRRMPSSPGMVASIPDEASAAAPASPPEPPAGSSTRYRGLHLGRATVEDSIARLGPPAARSDEPETRTAELDYGRSVDPRGRLRLFFEGESPRLRQVLLDLEPPLPLADVLRDEHLKPGPGCAPGSREPLERPEADELAWPSRGLALWLDSDGRVLALVHRQACR